MSNYNPSTDPYHRYSQTRRGDFVVWQGSNQIGRFDDEVHAADRVKELLQAHDQSNRDMAARAESLQSFWSANPDLTTRTLTWQNWRNRFYGEMQHEGRRLHGQAMFLMNANTDSPSYGKHADYHACDVADLNVASNAYNDRITDMSRVVGEAGWSFNRAAWEAAITAAEQLMNELRETASHISGTWDGMSHA